MPLVNHLDNKEAFRLEMPLVNHLDNKEPFRQ